MKCLRFLCTTLLLLCCVAVHAHDFKVGGIYYNITDAENKTVEVTTATGSGIYTYSGNLVIPSTVTYKGLTYDVTSIGTQTFGVGRLSSLTIPKSIINIKRNGSIGIFQGIGDSSQLLTTIVVEEGNPVYDSRENCNAIIETATNTILYGCNNTIIPESIVTIGKYAFYRCKLTAIHIPQSVKKIDWEAFFGCTALKTVHIDNLAAWCNIDFQCTLFSGNEGEIYLNNELVTNLTIPDGISKLSSRAFQNCTSLVSLTIPQGLTQIGSTSFAGCSSLENVVVENGNPVYDSHNNCNAIIETATKSLVLGCKNTIIPEDVTSIGTSAFEGCTGLTSITIPNSITSIGDNAFSGCKNLKEVTTLPTIPPTLGYGAFGGCNSPTLIYPENSNYFSWSNYFSNLGYYENGISEWWVDNEGNATVVCKEPWNSENHLDAYNGDKIIKAVYIEEGFTHIGGLIVNGDNCKYVEKVILPSTTQVIGDNAFDGYALTEIYLPEGLKEIGDDAFWGCRLKFVVIPSTVETIGSCAFWGYENEGHRIDPIVIFKTFTPPYIKGDLGSYNICVPEEGNGYDNVSQTFTAGKEYVTGHFGDTGNTIFVFGKIYDMNFTDIGDGFEYDYEMKRAPTLDEADAIVFMPEVEWYEFIQTMPNLKVVDVVEKSNFSNGYYDDFIYTIKGSNCIYSSGDGSLVAGCAASVIPEGTHRIASSAFYRSGLKEIVIPEGVNYIGNNAFYECTGLQEINIPESVQTIDGWAFSGCSGLKNVTVLGGAISQSAFGNCKNLERLTIGKNVTSIANYSFNNCTALKTIAVDAQNTTYDSRNNCNAIIETASNKLVLASNNGLVPAEVTAIGTGAFSTCPDFDVTVPAVITEVENEAFKGVSRLWFESENPASITGNVFGWGAIYVPTASYDTYCNAPVWTDYKDRIVTPELANRDIEVYSTEGMSGILDALGLNDADRTVKLKVKGEINSYDIIMIRDKMPLLNELDLSEAKVIPSSKPFYQDYCTGKNSLAGYAFYDLDKLLTVKLPKDLIILGDYAFANCDKLLSVDASKTGELSIGNYALNGCVKLYEFVSPEKISEVGSYAFSGSTKLESIELRQIAGSIGEYAFQGCGKLNTIDIAAIGGEIQQYAFRDCYNLEEVTVGTMGGDLNDEAFGYCSALKKVVFAQGPVRIGTRVFVYSDALETFIAGEGNREVAQDAFMAVKLFPEYNWGFIQWVEKPIDRISLSTVVLPQSTEAIGKNAFARCTAMSNFAMPQGVTTIGTSAFSKCQALERISIPDGVTHIPNQAFEGCSALKDVSLSNNVTTIGGHAFNGCSALKNVNFSDNVTNIGSNAFAGCGFENLKLPPTLVTIADNAFANCKGLTELHIPSAVENIGGQAFSGCSLLNDIYTYTVEPTTITETTFSTFNTATLHVPMTSFWNYYWNIGWSRFNHKLFQDFNKPYDYFYLNNDYYLNGSTGYIEGTPDADMRPGSGLIVESDKDAADDQQNLGDVIIGSDGNGNSGVIIGDENLHIDNLHVKINVKKGRWYFFAFPWDVPFKKISMQKGSDYVFRYYDGEERAKNGNGGWKNVNENHLKAARGYIFQSSGDDVLLISIDDVKFKKEDKYNELITHTSDNMNDASWNLMGNPYLSYYDMGAMNYSAPVTVWDGEKYVAIRPGDDDYQFSPYEAFFVQKPEGTASVGFNADNQMTKTQKETLKESQAKARMARKIDVQRLLVNLVLEHDSVTDRTRVVFNNRQKMTYETVCDAAKFETTGVPQLYTLDDDGVRYAINERPMNDGVVRIGFTASLSGEYTLNAVRMDTEVVLYDAEMNVVHDFKNGAYAFYSDKGTFEDRFTLGVPNNETTGVEEVELEQVVEVIEGGIAFSADATVTIYNAAGVAVATQHGAGTVMLQPGVYVVSVGNKNLKVVVK